MENKTNRQWCVVILLADRVQEVYGPFESGRSARAWEDRQTKPFPEGSRAVFRELWAPS